MNLVTLAQTYDDEDPIYTKGDKHGFWPLDQIDPTKSRFPCCLVWTPLPVVSWLAPFIGHVGLCMEDGAVVDFSGSNLVTIDDFAYGSVARYIQLDREQCCFPSNLSSHTCNHRYKHSEIGTAISWDDAIQSTRRHFEHKSYNLFTCNCHSFAANCLNRVCYGGSMSWNMINVAALVLFRGRWVNAMAVIRSFLPFVVMVCFGVSIVGWPFLIGLFSFSVVLIAWYSIGTHLEGGQGNGWKLLQEYPDLAVYIQGKPHPFTRLCSHYPILSRGVNGTVAHEFIVDLRPLKTTAGIEPEDVAKRLIDYGFNSPTMSFPVPGTLMIEPTESESKAELDRFCDALISIREEIAEIEQGKADINNNVIKGAPHPLQVLMVDKWTNPYSREYAAFPASWLRSAKFWPTTCRVDNVYGDRNLICTLQPPHEEEEKAAATA